MQLHLEDLLQDDRDRAINLLKKVLDPTNNLQLSEVHKALELEWVARHLADLTVSHVLSTSTAAQETKRAYRPRVSFDKAAVKPRVVEFISEREGTGGATVNAMFTDLHTEFPELRESVVAQIVRELEKDGVIYASNTRPKLWRKREMRERRVG